MYGTLTVEWAHISLIKSGTPGHVSGAAGAHIPSPVSADTDARKRLLCRIFSQRRRASTVDEHSFAGMSLKA